MDPVCRLPIFIDGVVPAGSDLNDGSEAGSGGRVGVRESSVAAYFNGGDPARDDANSLVSQASLRSNHIRDHPAESSACLVGELAWFRAPCASRMGALEKMIRGFAERDGEEVIKLELGNTFNSLTKAYHCYNLYSWEHRLILTPSQNVRSFFIIFVI
ncbi:hypothetical protein VPH35_076294 [Triticum aestivum]